MPVPIVVTIELFEIHSTDEHQIENSFVSSSAQKTRQADEVSFQTKQRPEIFRGAAFSRARIRVSTRPVAPQVSDVIVR